MGHLAKNITWNDLSWDNLVYITNNKAEHSEDWNQRLSLWMRLQNLEISDETIIDDKWEELFVFQEKGNPEGALYTSNLQDMIPILDEGLRFLSYPIGGLYEKDKTKQEYQGLTAIPKEYLRIGRKVYRLPQPLLLDISYQQYVNIQKLTQVAWDISEKIRKSNEKLTELKKRVDKLCEKGKLTEGTTNKIKLLKAESENIVKEMGCDAKELSMARARVVAHILTRRKLQLFNNEGGMHIEIKWVWPYDPVVADKEAKYLERHAPWWLFDILGQNIQSCLAIYKKQFPNLFGPGSGPDDKLPIINEIGSVNAVMKWQGYQQQQSVYDSNAVFIFSILDSMTKEAKTIEDANNRMRRKQ